MTTTIIFNENMIQASNSDGEFLNAHFDGDVWNISSFLSGDDEPVPGTTYHHEDAIFEALFYMGIISGNSVIKRDF